MKSFLLILLASAALSFAPSQSTPVYYCANGSTKVYHVKKDCHGIKRCIHEIKKVTKGKAKEMGLRLCGYED